MENEKAMEVLSDFMNKLSLRLSLTKYNNDSCTSLFVLNRGYIKKLFEAVNLAISAIKTVDDGNFIYADTDSVYKMKTKLNSIYGKMCCGEVSEKVDIKTIYEQITMRFELYKRDYVDINHCTEVFYQPDTPIVAYIGWKYNRITQITFTIKENLKL